ncbi:MAG: DUF3095 family protein [Bacteroidota bacterium]
MPTNSSTSFYQDLPTFQRDLSALLSSDDNFQSVPADWHVIVTDVKNSTIAVSKGQHEDVNLVATGSIIAVLNIAYQHNTLVPFFFGGDGATLIVPHALLDQAMASLLQHQENSRRNFALELRVGQVKVADLYQAQHQISIAKWEVDPAFAIPIVLGGGLAKAEKMVKADRYELQHKSGMHALDLTGMECRWNKIKPPQDVREVVCLLVAFTNNKDNRTVAKQVMDAIEKIYGSRTERNPISVKRLQLDTSIAKINREVSVKFGQPNWFTLIKTSIVTFLAQFFYFKASQEGRNYLNRLVELSDTLVIDGRISTIISGTSAQRLALSEQLEKLEETGQIKYGMHVTQESIMSCYVRDREHQHIHFVDGADGGYTRAAVHLKQKLA